MSFSRFVVKFYWFVVGYLDKTLFHGRYPDAAVPLSGCDTSCEMGNERGYMECRMCNEYRTNIPAYRPITEHFMP
jgi:hypothetical protein